MNARIALARAWFPGFLKKRKLLDLIRAAAEAFSVALPDFRGESYAGLLGRFTDLAEDWSLAAVREGRENDVSARLFDNSRRLGQEARRALRPRNPSEVMEAARVLYTAIGIDFRGDVEGNIRIRHCAFSRRFSPGTCRLMSSMDAGILSGLAGTGSLAFSARLTEGAEACLARLTLGGEDS